LFKFTLNFTAAAVFLLALPGALATDLDLAKQPLFTEKVSTPMMMLVMGRDHTLYYEAYTDASDLDGDGVLDIRFKPSISYDGYFDPKKCYEYNTNNKVFKPKEKLNHHKDACTDNAQPWSGNFLNYLTMTRMDVLRKVLYGGYRSTDNAGNTKLDRVYIPQDGHSWAKGYTSIDNDKYDIADYTPLSVPTAADRRHFFGTASFNSDVSVPILAVVEDQPQPSGSFYTDWGPWSWASKEAWVLQDSNITVDHNYEVRVKVCVTDFMEENCKKYIDGSTVSYKPTGLLQDYGDTDKMLFGLLTGSYDKHLSGGVLRKAIDKFSEEVNADGTFKSTVGIVNTINNLKISGHPSNNKNYQPSWGDKFTKSLVQGNYKDWGNPIGEMLYESLRYFSGAGSPSSTYNTSGGVDGELGLPNATWDDPYAAGNGSRKCLDATNLVISDINPSYDSDQLPGANGTFAKSYSGSTLSSFNLSTLLNTISDGEGKTSGEYFIGEVAGTPTDNAPTAKEITGLGNIRGLAPAEPTKKGSYSSAGVAYYGKINDISTQDGKQKINTMVVAMASALPEVMVAIDGNKIKIVPFAKSVKGGGISAAETAFQPTNTIVDWYVEVSSPSGGKFRVSFEDVEQGNDHDMDMVVKYSYLVTDLCPVAGVACAASELKKGVQITLDNIYAQGGVTQHAGYIISGTSDNHDGLYLEVKDETSTSNDVKYYLDTPDKAVYQKRSPVNNGKLTRQATRNFFPSASVGAAANFLPSPLWYAAKWGGFKDSDDDSINEDGKPNILAEWDSDADEVPDTYFPVTNAGELKSQLAQAFASAFATNGSASAAVFNSLILTAGTLQYRSYFESARWSGDVKAYTADGNYNFDPTSGYKWSAAEKLDVPARHTTRHIFSRPSAAGATFVFKQPASITAGTDDYTQDQLDLLLDGYTGSDPLTYLKEVVNYIRGDRDNETPPSNNPMRVRDSVLGDVMHAAPYSVTASNGHPVGKEVLVFGANDGMVHVLDVDDGEELMAYIPSGVYDKLANLVSPTYTHQYSVDGGITAYTDENGKTTLVGTLGLGGKGLYAIDVSNMTTPATGMIEWEITPDTAGYSDLGFTAAAPTIVKLNNGEIGVIFANGYNSESDEATIYIAKLSDGSLIKKLTTGTTVADDPAGRANAMASPAVLDSNNDGKVDYIYAGDLYGNMWVFDITNDSDLAQWKNKKTGGKPLFKATSPTKNAADTDYLSQPITTQPQLSYVIDPVVATNSYVLVAFGTGKYIETTDNSPTAQATQSFYVIKDKLNTSNITRVRDSSTTQYSNIVAQQILKEENNKRHLTANAFDWDDDDGFYLDLVNTMGNSTTAGSNTDNEGERQATNSALVGNKIFFTTILPDNDVTSCTPGGGSWYMALDLNTGTSLDSGGKKADPTIPGDEAKDTSEDTTNDKDEDKVAIGVNAVLDEKGVLHVVTCYDDGSCKTYTYDDGSPILGRISWRQLY
jgi:type IV pilus assembly protein PilY1